MKLIWSDKSWNEYLYWQTQDKKILKKINSLIKDIKREPSNGLGKPEQLVGCWSRLVYEVSVLQVSLFI